MTRYFFVIDGDNYFFVYGTHESTHAIATREYPDWRACFTESMFDPSLFNLCLGEVK